MNIGERIKAERLKQGLKQIELARKADISISFLSDMENGRTMPSIKSLAKIAEALGIDCKYFFDKAAMEAAINPQTMIKRDRKTAKYKQPQDEELNALLLQLKEAEQMEADAQIQVSAMNAGIAVIEKAISDMKNAEADENLEVIEDLRQELEEIGAKVNELQKNLNSAKVTCVKTRSKVAGRKALLGIRGEV